MNAGAYGEGILERTDHLTLLRDGTIHDFRIEELDYGYRHLRLADGDIVLAATFKLEERAAAPHRRRDPQGSGTAALKT